MFKKLNQTKIYQSKIVAKEETDNFFAHNLNTFR